VDNSNNEEVNEIQNAEEQNVKKGEKKLSSVIIKAVIATIIFYRIILFCKVSYYSASGTIERKPIIYIYPEEEQIVSVELLDKELLTCSYPKYEKAWEVKASPNGDLIDLNTGNKLYSLYYESNCKENYKVEKEGFCIKKEDIIPFLEEKLEILGLNYKEKEEFIVYWLPQLEKYDYVYIRFADKEEINNNMKLEIGPKPETLIRVMMVWKGLNKPIEVEEQKLETTIREGYTVVEWGGSEIDR